MKPFPIFNVIGVYVLEQYTVMKETMLENFDFYKDFDNRDLKQLYIDYIKNDYRSEIFREFQHG